MHRDIHVYALIPGDKSLLGTLAWTIEWRSKVKQQKA